MPNENIPFAGQTLVLPAAYYADNVQGALLPLNPITPPLIFIGYGYGQKPNVAKTYQNPTDLLNAIRGGPCSGFVPFFFNPSPQLNGAQQVTYINASENTQSSLTLKNGAASGVIALTSTNYGAPSNLLQTQVGTGTQSGSKKLTVFDAYSGNQFVQDNLGVPFKLAYTGSASGVTYSVTVSGGVAQTFTTSSPNSGESVYALLGPGGYATVEQLVVYLGSLGFYNAQVTSQGVLPTTLLDVASSAALLSGTPLNYANVYSSLNDIVYWFNNTLVSGTASAAVTPGTSSVSGNVPVNIPLTPFTGAVSVAPQLSDYASAFNAALTTPGWSVFADTNASGVIALGVAHVATARQPNYGAWRRFLTGSSLGDSVNTTIANAQSCNSIGVTYVYPGIYANAFQSNINTLYSGLYAAAAVAGMSCGNPPATPLTNKQLTATGIEVGLSTGLGGQIDLLQQNGVMVLYIPFNSGVPTIASDLTTWQQDANPENVYNQQVSCRDYLAYTMVNTLQPWVGTVADPLIETKILNNVKVALNALLYNSGNANGILNTWIPSTLKLTYNGQQQLASLSVAVVFVGQNRIITMYVTVNPQANFQVQLAA